MHIQTSHGRAKSVSLQYKNFVNRNIVKDRPLLARFVLVLLCAPPGPQWVQAQTGVHLKCGGR